jgi:hypothetical protein
MRGTSFIVNETGVVLYDYHLWRFKSEAPEVRQAFQKFCLQALPGIYRATVKENQIEIVSRSPSLLFDGMPVRYRVSPFWGKSTGWFPKPSSPCPYDEMRVSGVATFLTCSEGKEIWESCSASLVGWEKDCYILAPEKLPRVASVSEQAIRDNLLWREAIMGVEETIPLALINAVKGICVPHSARRGSFPAKAKAKIEDLFVRLTRRPKIMP